LRYVSFSPGGRGTRRVESKELGGSLGFPGDFGKETDRNETLVFFRPPPEAPEKIWSEMVWARREPP
jgi:hypothetical protein